MVECLKKIDMYGLSFSFTTFGKTKFNTTCGGILTLCTTIVIAAFIFIFGSDFFLKTNPNLVESDLIHLTSKSVFIQNELYSFMFRLQDGNSVPYNLDEIPFKVRGSYFHFRKNKDGLDELVCNSYKEVITKCSNTKAMLNHHLKDEKLEQWLCWDMEKIKNDCRKQLKEKEPNYLPILGGYVDEKEYSALRFDIINWVDDFENNTRIYPHTKEEIDKYASRIFLNIRYPNFSYDAKRAYDPLRVYYDSKMRMLQTNTSLFEFLFLKIVTANDDLGWVLPSIVTSSTLASEKEELTISSNENLSRPWMYFYNGYYFNVKKEKEFNRSFMKLQTLVAVVGGMVKSVVAVFMFFAILRATFEREEELRRHFFKVKVRFDESSSKLQVQKESANVNTLVTKKSDDNRDARIGFWTYLFRFCGLRAEIAEKVLVYEKMREYINGKMDITYLFKTFEEFNSLKDIVLTEEQKELVEHGKTEIELEA